MDLKKVIIIIIYLIWVIFAITQQVVWISQGLYNIIGFVWFLMITITPYLLYKYWDK